jgi:uncharacterized BrkB/YihY/UPF0761 family membrane protein
MESVRLRAEAVRTDLESKRDDTRYVNIAFLSLERDLSTGGGILAGAIAFRFFLFIIPYVFVAVFAFGFGADVAEKSPTEVARHSGIVGLAATAIDAAAETSTLARVLTLGIALWALMSGARMVFKSLRAVHALIWRVPLPKARNLTRNAVLTVVVLTTLIAVERLVWLAQQVSIALWVVSLVFVTAVPIGVWLWLTLKVFPSAPGTNWRDLLPGAVLIGVGVQGLHIVTIVWIARSLESKSETYGAMGASLTILLWAYLLGRLVTMSATLSAVMWDDKQRSAGSQVDPKSVDVPIEADT